MAPRTKRERLMLLIALLLIPAILIGNALVPSGPPAGQKSLLPVDQANLKREVQTRTITQMRQEQQEMEPRIAQMAYNLPPDEIVPRVIGDLQRTAVRAGVHLREIKPMRPSALSSGAGARVPMEVTFRAPLQPNAVQFLYYVEDPAARFVVDKIHITSADAKFRTVEAVAEITVFTRSTAGVAGIGGQKSNGKSQQSNS